MHFLNPRNSLLDSSLETFPNTPCIACFLELAHGNGNCSAQAMTHKPQHALPKRQLPDCTRHGPISAIFQQWWLIHVLST